MTRDENAKKFQARNTIKYQDVYVQCDWYMQCQIMVGIIIEFGINRRQYIFS
jgi:hypothetical protein